MALNRHAEVQRYRGVKKSGNGKKPEKGGHEQGIAEQRCFTGWTGQIYLGAVIGRQRRKDYTYELKTGFSPES
jgi:hypothetical protein